MFEHHIFSRVNFNCRFGIGGFDVELMKAAELETRAGEVYGSCFTEEQMQAANRYAELVERITKTDVKTSPCFNAGATVAYIRRFKK